MLHPTDHGLAHDLETLTRQATSRRRTLRWLAVGGMAPLALATPALADTAVDAQTVFQWAEATYPQWFPASAGTLNNGSYLYRHYPTTDNYLGVGLSDTRLYAYGRDTAYQWRDLGALSTWLAVAGGSASTSCSLIPQETAGPYPGDGTNSSTTGVANALTLAGIVRPDIRASVGGASGVASGVPLMIELALTNTASGCAALAGYVVYLWHCTRDGLYSMYSNGVTGENFLRGVQASDSSGVVRFQSIFPGCYAGRMPHIHFEVYRSLASATRGSNAIRTSQIALPTTICQQVYASEGYQASVNNLARISFATDNVFSDGVTSQLATVTGDTSQGYLARLNVGVSG